MASPPRLAKTKLGFQFHKLNTVDNLFQHYYGFQTGQLIIAGAKQF